MATDLKGELTCPICMELFHRPLRLPCGHSYCRNCLQVFIGQQSQKDIVTGQHRPVKCPECRYMLDVTSQGADTFPVDFKLSKLVDVYMKMEDMENSNETKKANAKDDDHDPENDETTDPALLGACGYTPTTPHDAQQEPDVKKTPEKSKDDPGAGAKPSESSERTRRKVVYGESSDTDSDKDDSDDSTNRSEPRRRKRRNKVIRFFASLLSLSSSDGEYDLREASSSSSDIDTSRPVREVKPAAPKDVPRRRNRWGFFTSSSESEQNVASSDEEGQPNGRPPRRKPPQKKSSSVITSIQRRLKPSSSDDDMIN